MDSLFAWAANGVVCLYFAWVSVYLWRSGGTLAKMYEGMGAQLPVPMFDMIEELSS